MIRCQSQHCCCCGGGATMTAERKAGLREPMCADCYIKLRATLGLRDPRRIAFPCDCAPTKPRPVRARYVRPTRYLQVRDLQRMAVRSQQKELRAGVRKLLGVVLQAVAARYRVSDETLLRPSRSHAVCGPRGVAMYLMRAHTLLSHSEIARFFGVHHTTVVHHDAQVRAAMEKHEALRTVAAEIRGYLDEPCAETHQQLMALPLLGHCEWPVDVARYLPGGINVTLNRRRARKQWRERKRWHEQKKAAARQEVDRAANARCA